MGDEANSGLGEPNVKQQDKTRDGRPCNNSPLSHPEIAVGRAQDLNTQDSGSLRFARNDENRIITQPDEADVVVGSKGSGGEKAGVANKVSRRSFVLGVGGIAVLCGVGALRFAPQKPLVRPPGGQDEDRMLAACIRCQRCYEACPRDVIRPAKIENGIVTVRTPTFDFSNDYCDWCQESNDGIPQCVKVCPTFALELPEGATPKDTILGKAELNKSWCLAYKLIGCRYCFDACPYEAMGIDDIGRPYVIEEKCNGCGACECVCVSLKNASISSGATERAIVVRQTSERQGGEA